MFSNVISPDPTSKYRSVSAISDGGGKTVRGGEGREGEGREQLTTQLEQALFYLLQLVTMVLTHTHDTIMTDGKQNIFRARAHTKAWTRAKARLRLGLGLVQSEGNCMALPQVHAAATLSI